MRRTVLLTTACFLAAAAVLAGCGSNSSPGASAGAAVKVSGSFGSAPKVAIPDTKAGSALTVKTVHQGNGPVFRKTDSFLGDTVVYIWTGIDHHLLQSTFASATSKTNKPQIIGGSLLPGLETALVGKRMGSRVLAVIPPKDAYGKSGNSQAGISANDTLVFVVDLIKDFPAQSSATGKQVSTGGGSLPTVTATSGQPKITISTTKQPPTSLVAKTLIKGTGPVVTKGETLIVQYVGAIWRTGKVFQATWTQGEPFSFIIGANPSQVITGWDSGLLGQTVGSRVLLVIPPKDGYGSAGQSQIGVKGTDTLVFAVDIIAAFPPSAIG